MYCYLICGLALVILFSMIYMMLIIDKSGELEKVLNTEELNRYKNIVKERRNLMLQGYIFGIAIAIISIQFFKNDMVQICAAVVITYLCSYIFYTLSPKSDYMLIHLDTVEKREAWLKVYLKMKNNYHFSMLLGLLFVALLTLLNSNLKVIKFNNCKVIKT